MSGEVVFQKLDILQNAVSRTLVGMPVHSSRKIEYAITNSCLLEVLCEVIQVSMLFNLVVNLILVSLLCSGLFVSLKQQYTLFKYDQRSLDRVA